MAYACAVAVCGGDADADAGAYHCRRWNAVDDGVAVVVVGAAAAGAWLNFVIFVNLSCLALLSVRLRWVHSCYCCW